MFVLFESFWAENFGHALGDDALPVYALLRDFRLDKCQTGVLTKAGLARNLGASRPRGERFLRTFFRLLHVHPILSLSETSNNPTQPLTCFHDVLAGHGTAGMMYDQDRYWSDFIALLLRNMALESKAAAQAINTRLSSQLIVLLDKRGRRRVTNIQEAASHIATTFRVLVQVVNPANMSFEEQVVLAQRTTVLITPCGGISFFAAFLKSRATAIFMGYWDPKSKRSGRMEAFIWSYVSRLNDMYYDVVEAEVIIRAPGNATRKNNDDFRNHGDITMALPKLERLVASALQHGERVFDLDQPSFFRRHMP